MNVEINFITVLLAAIASMVVGFLWYSPMVLGKPWMKLMGLSASGLKDAQKKMGMYYGVSMALALITAYVLAHVMALSENYFGYPIVQTGLTSAFWSWLGFMMPIQASSVLFSGKKIDSDAWHLFGINTGYQLASLLVMGLVLAYLK